MHGFPVGMEQIPKDPMDIWRKRIALVQWKLSCMRYLQQQRVARQQIEGEQ
jgi:hypothetical protein